MSSIFVDVALILSLTAIFAAIFSRFRQPLLLAYLLVGILVASSGAFGHLTADPTFDFMAELGIAFALFLIGLELKFSNIKQIGRAAITIGLGQITITSLIGFFVARVIGFNFTEAAFIAVALTFSSTIIVIKILEQKRDLDSLYGKITTGFLIVQDFFAVGALIFVASIGKGGGAGEFVTTAISGALLVAVILLLNKYVLQKVFDLLAKSTEVLFLGSISWALIFAAVSAGLGFSIEIGAFLAGLGLATLREEQQIASWIRPLRNLFVIIFFLSLGLKLSLATLVSLAGLVIVLSLFVLVGNPLIIITLMGLMGFRRRTAFHVAISSAQISEFSLIFVFLGNRLGLVSERVVNTTVAVALITIVLSTYLMTHSSKIYRRLSPFLKIFQRKNLSERTLEEDREFSDHIILVGMGRLGTNILKSLRKRGENVVVVDFDPNVVKRLENLQIPVLYGDISDPEIFEKAIGKGPQMIISTVFDKEDTDIILEEAKNYSKKLSVVVTSPTVPEALNYYKQDAAYVIIPRVLSSTLVEKYLIGNNLEALKNGELRKEHLEQISNHTPAKI